MTEQAQGGLSLIGTSGDSLREAYGKTQVELADRHRPKFVVFDADVVGGAGTYYLFMSHTWRF